MFGSESLRRSRRKEEMLDVVTRPTCSHDDVGDAESDTEDRGEADDEAEDYDGDDGEDHGDDKKHEEGEQEEDDDDGEEGQS